MNAPLDATVLVVDDSESVASLIAEGLKDVVSGISVAKTGGEAIDLLTGDTFQLVLLDHRLPDMTGIEVVRSLADRGIIVPFVTITGHGDEKVAVEMMKLGAHDYLIKDEHFLDLLPTVVRRVLNQLETELRLKAAEEELAVRELSYRELFDHMKSGVVVLAPISDGRDFVFSDLSRAAERISGLKREELLGKSLLNLFPEVKATSLFAVLQEVYRTGEAISVTDVFFRHETFSGWWAYHLYQLPSSEMVIIFDDITERKQAEDDLRQEKRKYLDLYNEFHTLLNGIPDCLSLLDLDLKVVWCNSSYDRHFGQAEGERRHRHCYRIWHGADEPCEDCPVLKCFATGESQESLRRSGSRIYGVKAFPLKNESGETVKVINLSSDVTEKIRLRDEAAQASRLASLGELSAGVAHEINNPNALILLNSPLLEEIWSAAAPILARHFRENGDFKLGGMSYSRVRDEVPRLQAEIGEAARRIKTIVEDLKNFVAQDDREMLEPTDLNAVGEKAVRLVGGAIKKATQHFRTEYHPGLPAVMGHFGRLEQVAVNLLLNACQAVPTPDREVVLSTRYEDSEGLAVLEVRDQGVGIPPENLPRLTDPFFTTRRESGGTGLGLSVSARIAEEHGGTLHFLSEPGTGTVVSLVLPVGDPSERPRQNPPGPPGGSL